MIPDINPVSPIGDKFENKAVRALLLIEFHENGGGTLSCIGCGSWTFQKIHENYCPINLALIAAGYITNEERDKARYEISKEEISKQYRWKF